MSNQDKKHLSLFSGIGGFDLAAQWAGWENIAQVEIDPFCQKVLQKNFPNAKRYGNIKEFDGSEYRGIVDIISGGFPCQPFSNAGERKGTNDERHLWPEMLRVIREIQPEWVVGENVRGIVSWSDGLVFEQVCVDLEGQGYDIQPYILPASAVNAPHERYRVWFVAHSNRSIERGVRRKSGKVASQKPVNSNGGQDATNSKCFRQQGSGRAVNAMCSTQDRKGQTDRIEHEFRWTTEPTIRGGNNGLSDRVDRIKGLGNAIVPQVAYRIFDTINQYDEQNR